MSKLSFVKYQGAGNDFILIDDRALHFNSKRVPELCHRRFGVGADGVILLQHDSTADFRMRIYNSDGTEAGSCGNGLRCLMRFIADLGLPQKSYRIATGDRVVLADFVEDRIRIQMGAAQFFRSLSLDGLEIYSLDTGVPHAVVFSPRRSLLDLGPFLRNHPVFQPEGTNVNLAELQPDGSIYIRTYERGVEGETLACGTGAAAVGFAAAQKYGLPNPIRVCSAGGEIEVQVDGINLTILGWAVKSFEGIF